MTGLERNADVVKLASYATAVSPTRTTFQWRPDLVWFNNHASWGSANYEVQNCSMNNVGSRVVPSTATGTPSLVAPISGAVGLSDLGDERGVRRCEGDGGGRHGAALRRLLR
ncbi:alpha-L-arabinofuranosidase C-terminal domain-containing protein [Streptomyces sp. L7]